MALEDIQRAVLESARAEAARLTEAARRNADAVLSAESETMHREAERRYDVETRAIEEDFARKLVQHKGVANKRVLERRNERLSEVFALARRQILGWPREEYMRTMRLLLERATEDTGGALRVHPDDRSLFAEVLTAFNADRSADRQVTLDAEPLPERGGFVFISRDFEVDNTLTTLLADLEHEMSPRIAAELFRKT